MKFKVVFTVLTAALMASACSNTRDVAEGEFDYVNAQVATPVARSGSLQVEDANNRFAVPEIPAQEEAALGAQVSIRPPQQVIAAAPGTRIEEGLRESRVYFDIVEGMEDLKAGVWRQMISVFDAFEMDYTRNEERGLLSSERFRTELYRTSRPGWRNRLTGEDIIAETELQVALEFTLARHGRSGVLEARVIEPQFYLDGELQPLPMNFARSYEARLLNNVSSAIARAYRSDRAVFARATMDVELGTTRAGQAAYTLSTDFATAWVLMPGVFSELNFRVDDLNQSEGMYYVSYEPFGDRGWLRRLAFWRSRESTPLGVQDGTEMTFSVDEIDGVVYIVPQIDGEAVSAETLAAWFPLVSDAFSVQQDR